MFPYCILLLHATLSSSRPVLAHLWVHYCGAFAVPSVQEHVRGRVRAELLTLPWDRLAPQLRDAQRFAQVLDICLPEARSFAAQVVVRLPWKEVVEAYDRESPTAGVRLRACLFNMLINILVRVEFEPEIRQSGTVFLLLSRTEVFSWHLLDAATYQSVLGWHIMSCDPVSVLVTDAGGGGGAWTWRSWDSCKWPPVTWRRPSSCTRTRRGSGPPTPRVWCACWPPPPPPTSDDAPTSSDGAL